MALKVQQWVDREISLKLMLKVGNSQHQALRINVNVLQNLHYFVMKVIKKFFTSLWGEFNWLAKSGTNHRVYSFKQDL